MVTWIGEEVNISGSYCETSCDELTKRCKGYEHKLYKFKSRFGQEYYISDVDVIEKIEKCLSDDDHIHLYEYLYGLLIERFGMIELLVNIGHRIAYEYDRGYSVGKKIAQKEMRSALGLW